MEEALPYILIALVGFVAGVVSGISGGGGGMLIIPAYIFVGLPPQIAVATGKMSGLGAAFGGLSAFFKTGQIRKEILRVMLPIAVIIGVTTPFIFAVIGSESFQLVLGLVLLLLVPTLFIKKKPAHIAAKKHRVAGYTSYSGVLTIQALFGSGVGSIALFILTLLLGTTKLEANATKRAVTAILTPITFVALLIAGYVALLYGTIGLATVFSGTYLGSKLALKRGEKFVTPVMAAVIVIAGVVLVVDALGLL